MRTSRSVPGTTGLRQQPGHEGGVEALAGVAVATRHDGRAEHRVEHRLLGGVDDGLEEVVEAATGDARVLRRSTVAVGTAGGGRGQEDLATAVVRGRARAGQPEADP